ncbi:MAG: YkgJ family cysteine cluster protein [Desulfatitalea sp.]|nr:YkgJ family cysteine cluster protein [Desulfatitalea sp.]
MMVACDPNHSCSIPRDAVECPDDAGVSPVDTSLLCRECARTGHTCCQGHDIYVTVKDCRRIEHHTRQHDFFEFRGCTDAAYADQTDDPLWRQFVFRPDGSRRVLKRHPDGDCFFLAAEGCLLPLAVRPLVCRLFPHTYSARGIDTAWDPECPAARCMPGAVIEAQIAGVASMDAAQWHLQLYRELVEEDRVDENWTDL